MLSRVYLIWFDLGVHAHYTVFQQCLDSAYLIFYRQVQVQYRFKYEMNDIMDVDIIGAIQKI